MSQEEIIIHKNQTTIEDYLKEDNPLCLECRWEYQGKCISQANSDYTNKPIKEIMLSECSYHYNVDDERNFSSDDEEMGRLL